MSSHARGVVLHKSSLPFAFTSAGILLRGNPPGCQLFEIFKKGGDSFSFDPDHEISPTLQRAQSQQDQINPNLSISGYRPKFNPKEIAATKTNLSDYSENISSSKMYTHMTKFALYTMHVESLLPGFFAGV